MATTVYTVEELALDDGSTIICKPANIAVLRKGTTMLEATGDAENNDEGIHALLDVVCLCLKRQRPDFEKEVELTNDDGEPILDANEKVVTKKVTNYELMEELFDLSTMFKVIEIYLGVKLNDPGLLEAASRLAEMKQEQEQAGKTSTSQS